jgi:hypothetical protein
LPALVAAAPKAELHLHIEGTLEPEMAFAIGQRNGVALPYPDPEAMRRAYAFSDLQSFLDIYYAAAAVLLHEQDFFELAWAYLERAKADNVVRAEIFFDPQTHTARGVPFETVVAGLSRAVERARTELGVSAALIMCFLRHLSEREAFETLEQATPYRGQLVGVVDPPGEAARIDDGVDLRCQPPGFDRPQDRRQDLAAEPADRRAFVAARPREHEHADRRHAPETGERVGDREAFRTRGIHHEEHTLRSAAGSGRSGDQGRGGGAGNDEKQTEQLVRGFHAVECTLLLRGRV